MKVVLFPNLKSDKNPSMSIYFTEISKYLPTNVTALIRNSRHYPIIKNYFYKEFIYPLVARKNAGDVNHILDHSYSGLLLNLDSKKTIVTCHDLIPLEMPSSTSFFGRLRFWLNIRNLKKAKIILADSQATKNSIMHHFNIPDNKIRVVPLGVSESFCVLKNKLELKKKYQFPNKTILSVGSCYPRKNVELVLNALVQDKNIFLVRVGDFSKNQIKFIKNNNLEKRIKQFFNISEKELIELYNAVDIFVMPSLAEGFGLPVLEAMACGCPVICSDIPVFRELFSSAVEFFSLTGPDSLVKKIKEVLNSENLQKQLSQKGRRLSKKFNWKKTAEKTYEVYEEVYNENKKS